MENGTKGKALAAWRAASIVINLVVLGLVATMLSYIRENVRSGMVTQTEFHQALEARDRERQEMVRRITEIESLRYDELVRRLNRIEAMLDGPNRR